MIRGKEIQFPAGQVELEIHSRERIHAEKTEDVPGPGAGRVDQDLGLSEACATDLELLELHAAGQRLAVPGQAGVRERALRELQCLDRRFEEDAALTAERQEHEALVTV